MLHNLHLFIPNAHVFNDGTALNVLRMIKLFGWEKKMNDRIAAKREEELDLIKKRQFLDLLNNTFK